VSVMPRGSRTDRLRSRDDIEAALRQRADPVHAADALITEPGG
jgi:hypothetical protein